MANAQTDDTVVPSHVVITMSAALLWFHVAEVSRQCRKDCDCIWPAFWPKVTLGGPVRSLRQLETTTERVLQFRPRDDSRPTAQEVDDGRTSGTA